jgi:16S rRNA G966 N2-methylase RsmD
MGQLYSIEEDKLDSIEEDKLDSIEKKFNEIKETDYNEVKRLETKKMSTIKMLLHYNKQLSDKKQKLEKLNNEMLLKENKLVSLKNELHKVKEKYFRQCELLDDYKYNKSHIKNPKIISDSKLSNTSLV